MIALITLITFFTLPSISSAFKASLNGAAREMATVTKEAYNAAVMTGRVYRVVYDLKEHQYWVEAGPNDFLLETAESKEKEERRKRFRRADEKEASKPSFALDKSVTRKKQSLPRGVEFEDIIPERAEGPVTEGQVYTHIFPHGITEQTVIHLKDLSDHKSSLVVNVLSGKTRVIDRYVDRKEAYGTD